MGINLSAVITPNHPTAVVVLNNLQNFTSLVSCVWSAKTDLGIVSMPHQYKLLWFRAFLMDVPYWANSPVRSTG